MSHEILLQLEKTLQARQQANPDDSYVASLNHKGLNKILEKIGEEATEVILAAKDHETQCQPTSAEHLVYETADLWFHCCVLLAHQHIPINTVLNELKKRMGTSGHQEKAQRAGES